MYLTCIAFVDDLSPGLQRSAQSWITSSSLQQQICHSSRRLFSMCQGWHWTFWTLFLTLTLCRKRACCFV